MELMLQGSLSKHPYNGIDTSRGAAQSYKLPMLPHIIVIIVGIGSFCVIILPSGL